MPRQPRLDAPITLYHGMVRGSERTALFRDDADRTELVTRLAPLVPVTGLTVSARAPLLIAYIEQPEVIDMPVPGTCLRLPVAFATQTGADTHRQTADREDPDAPGPLARPPPQPARGGTRCHSPCNGSPCRVIREVAPAAPEVAGVRPAPIHGRSVPPHSCP
jgi:hypothetical protein